MAEQTYNPTRSHLRSLALAALEGYERALTIPLPKTSNVEQAADSLYVMAMARRLPLGEIERLGEATQLREIGFQLARGGEFFESFELLQEARRLLEEKPLSYEASQCAETFQTAAEAYLHYRQGWFEQARESLHGSINSCLILHDQFGYPAEMRRIHLARNVARVSAAAGNRPEAVRIAAILACRIACTTDAWPWPRSPTTHTPDRLSVELAGFMLDQVLAELGGLLTSENWADVNWLNDRLGWMDNVGDVSNPWHLRLWWAAYRAFIVGNNEAFLRNALYFVQEGRGRLSQTWGELANTLVSIAQMLVTDSDSGPH